VLENGIFVYERKEVTVGWRKLHNEELLFLLTHKSRRIRRLGHVTLCGEKWKGYNAFDGET